MKMRSLIPWLLCLTMTISFAAQVHAHHSFAGYDLTKVTRAQGTIKEFRWGSPHAAAVFTIIGPNGKPQDINVASASPSQFVKQGFNPRDFKAGQRVEVMWFPTRGGKPGGFMSGLKFPDGREFKDAEVGILGHFQDSKKQADEAE